MGRQKGGANSSSLTTCNYGPGSDPSSVFSSYWKKEKLLNIFEPVNDTAKILL